MMLLVCVGLSWLLALQHIFSRGGVQQGKVY
jgi:hypothetical protein